MAATIYRVQVADGASAYLLLDLATTAASTALDAPPESVAALVRSTVQLAKEIAAGDLLRFVIDTSARGGSDLEAVVRFDRSTDPHLAVTLFVPHDAKRPDSGLHAVADAVAATVRARHAPGVAAVIAKAGTKEAAPASADLRAVMARDAELAAAIAAIVTGSPHRPAHGPATGGVISTAAPDAAAVAGAAAAAATGSGRAASAGSGDA